MREISKVYKPKKVENRIYNLWLRSGFFNPDKLPKRHKRPYCIVIPPPNITGNLHIGHALNATCQDILIRWRRLQGYKTLWLPGTDHAGIATQVVVEKELKKEGLSRFDLGRKKFIERVWQWKEKYEDVIWEQFRKLGCSLDWSRNRFTLDKKYTKAVEAAFLHYYKKGWIYQGERVVNWCPRCQTSLSDLEIEYKEEKGHLWYIKYPLSTPPGRVVVATTRPETMLGDTAVAVNPKDKRYKNLIGEKVILPLAKREIPIIADELVDPKFGTGAIKVTPAHDLIDYQISLKHNLPTIHVIDEQAKITKEAPLPYQGLKVLEARQKVVEDLKNQDLLEKIEDYTHRIPKCYRCATTIELIPSQQWFLKMAELAKMSEEPVKTRKIKFHPKRFEKGYFDWLKNIKDWCISRQIWWGHKIPIKDTEDVLDTWFSSALWPFAILGWPAEGSAKSGRAAGGLESAKATAGKARKSDLETFYPTDVLSTDRGIINLWVARMIFSGMKFMKKIPFKNVYVHATVLTKEGKRMSKSLGTGIDPLNLFEKYGADATRFGIAWQVMGGQDIRFVEDNILMGRKFCNKIWNATRFVLQQIQNSPKDPPPIFGGGLMRQAKLKSQNLTAADKRILKALEKTIKLVNKNLGCFQFGRAARILYNFFWHDFCDVYIEKSKSKIQNPKGARQGGRVAGGLESKNEKGNTQKILLYVLFNSLLLLHPFIPFITEEIYQKLPIKNKKKCLMVEEWPQ